MEVDKDKLVSMLVEVCPRLSYIGDGLRVCRNEYDKQCHAYLAERYGKCPPDCPHMTEAAANAYCKGDKCPRIKKLIKILKQ